MTIKVPAGLEWILNGTLRDQKVYMLTSITVIVLPEKELLKQ